MELSMNISHEPQERLVASECVPKQCRKSTHEHELNDGEYQDFNRDSIEGVFHTNSMTCVMSPTHLPTRSSSFLHRNGRLRAFQTSAYL